MRNLIFIGTCLAGCWAGLTGLQAGTFIARGEEWSGWPGKDAPPMTANAWIDVDYSDVGWLRGATPFRYGDGQDGTLITGMQNAYSTYFIRKKFTVPSASQVESLTLNMNYDDGFVAWVNGEEVLRVNAPSALSLNGFAPAGHESGNFEAFSLDDALEHLRDGENVLAIQGYNVSLSSSDFLLHPELTFEGPDTVVPVVVAVDPPPGLLEHFEEVTIQFSESVQGVDADDLILNGTPAERVTGSGDTYRFSFAQSATGELTLKWQQDPGITDFARTPNPFEWQAPSELRVFRVIDLNAPYLTRVFPLDGQLLKTFSTVEVLFSEPITGLDASDLMVNGIPAESLEGAGAGPYVFRFPVQTSGAQRLSWREGHGIEDFAAEPNALQSGEWNYQLESDVRYEGVEISEILAGNQSGLTDDDRDTVDWIELRNTTNEAIDLTGWSLSDDPNMPGQWMFDGQTIGPNEYLIVYASAKDRPNRRAGASPHTNFKLSRAGEFLGLFSPELPRRLVSDLGNRYPEQRNDHSYGRLENGSLSYFEKPTPGQANGSGLISEVLPEPHFSASRGYYDRGFQLVLSTHIEGAVVRYTLDHSEPTMENGTTYEAPITVTRTSNVRAAVFKQGYLPSKTVTHTYLFRLNRNRLALPIISLVTDENNLTGRTGIMETSPRNTTKRGRAWERPVSAEYFLPDGSTGFQIDCGLRIQGGNYVRERYNPNGGLPFRKYSFRLYFRGDYGESELNYPLIPRSPANSFKQIVLRAGMNDHSNPFVVDELVRRLSADMGQVSSQGALAHLYINGKYKGYYNPTERIDEDFLDTWQGGKGEYDIIAQFGEVRSGNTIEWNRLKQVLGRNLSLASNYLEAEQVLDIDNFIDYLILNSYVGTRDWPHNNWRAARERVDGAKWRFYVWDAEWSFFNQGGNVRHNTLTTELAVNQDIARFYRSLAKNGDFRVRFADRVHQHFFGDGALTNENILERFEELRSEISGVVRIANSIATSWVPNRRAIVLDQFSEEGLFLLDNVPQFSAEPGSIQDTHIALSSGGGEIYYTLDGTDPFLPERSSSDRDQLVMERATKSVIVPTDSSIPNAWRSDIADFDDSDWKRGRGGVGYDRAQTYREHIGIDVFEEMNGKNASVFVRIPFNVRLSELENVNVMNLLVKYDDGFAAYLNGRRIAYANAPTSLRWNSTATANHADTAAVQFQTFNVTDRMRLLREGPNLLALQGLNAQRTSSDFLLDTILEVGVLESGKPSPNAKTYRSPIAVNDVVDIRARSVDNGRWSALSRGVFYPGNLIPGIKFTEIMYNPPGGDAYEFVELTNFSPVAFDLSRYQLQGLSFEFPPDYSIPAGTSLLLASNENPEAFAGRYPSVEVDGAFGGSLSNSGELLLLEDAEGHFITGVRYGDEGVWDERTDGEGYSLELVDAKADSSIASSWRSSPLPGGSPGIFKNNLQAQGIVVSEIVAASEESDTNLDLQTDWIELENRGDVAIDLKGYQLIDETGRSGYTFGDEVVLQPGDFLVVRQKGAGMHQTGFSFGLDRDGDSVSLLNPEGNTVDSITFGQQLSGYSLIQNATGTWQLGTPTLGESNVNAPTAPLSVLRINEFLADPLPGDPDWLEVYNLHSDLPVDLTELHIEFNERTYKGTPYSYVGPRGYALFESSSSTLHETLRFRLPSVGGQLALLDGHGKGIDQVTFNQQEEGVSFGRVPDGLGRLKALEAEPSPGEANNRPTRPTLVINEVMAQNRSTRYDGVEGTPDWIELKNVYTQSIQLDGMTLKVNQDNVWTFPAGTQLNAGEHLVIWADGDDVVTRRPFNGFVMEQSLSASGDEITLVNAQGQVIDRIAYGIQIADQSIGRAGDQWNLLSNATPGQNNRPAATFGDVDDLRLNEWRDNGEGDDWLELFNTGDAPVLLSGLFLTDDPSIYGKSKHEIGSLSFIAPHSWVTFQADNDLNQGANHLGFKLSSQGETLRLYNPGLSLVDEVLVAGSTLLSGSFGRLPDGAHQIAFFNEPEISSGSPNMKSVDGLRINEALLNPMPPIERAIEVLNLGDSTIDLSGWAIGSEQTSLDAFRIAQGVAIQPDAFTVLHENSWQPSHFRDAKQWSLAPSDVLYISEIDPQGNPTGQRISLPLSRTLTGESQGTIETSMGTVSGRLFGPTFGSNTTESLEVFRQGMGAVNSLPWVGPVVMSELLIQTNETDPDWETLLGDVEYVELFNRSKHPVTLSSNTDATTAWRLRGGIEFDFESDLVLEPGQVVLIVNFDPAQEGFKLDAMKLVWSLPEGINVLGPFRNRLGNDGDQIRIQRLVSLPSPIGGGLVELHWLTEGRIEYTDQEPWPVPPTLDGTTALTRVVLDDFGNESQHWQYLVPSPGRASTHGGPGMNRLIRGISLVDGRFMIQLATEMGVQYQVQFTNDLNAQVWTLLDQFIGKGDTHSVLDDSPMEGARFYRVIVLP